MKKLVTIIVIFIASASALDAQPPAQHTANNRDQVLGGSGRVNPSTLAMEFSLPLGNYPGRGINVPVALSYSSKVWRIRYTSTEPTINLINGCYSVNEPVYAERSASGWTTSIAVPYIEYTGIRESYNEFGTPIQDDADIACDPRLTQHSTPRWVKRLVLHMPSGETHELRSSDSVTFSTTGMFEGAFYAADSSNIKYVQDSANGLFRALLPDGSFYDFDTGSGTNDRFANKFTDRNGNYTTYHAATTGYPNGYWTDTLGRNIAVPLSPSTPPGVGTVTYSVPGINGNVSYVFHWKLLKGNDASSSGLTNFSDNLKYRGDKYISGGAWQTRTSGFLFGSEDAGWIVAPDYYFNPVVLTEIELPTGQSYKFSYNIYGEIDKIIYPTGGEETFTYQSVASSSFMMGPYAQANRGVTDRKVYGSSTDTTPYEWTYSASTGVVRVTNPDGTKNERFMHTGNQDATYGYDNVLAGMPYKELTFTNDDHLVAQKLTHWTKSSYEWHPRVDYEESIVYDTSGNGVSTVARTDYEGDLSYKETPVLANKTTSYAFTTKTDGGSYSPGATPSASPTPIPTPTPPTPVKMVESTYLINDSNYSGVASYYTAQNMVGLVTVSKVKDGSGNVVSQSEMVYDESGRSPGYRGNPTSSRVWDNTKGLSTNSAAYISTHARFDTYGNQYEATDALGNTTTTAFDSTYYAFPVQVTSPIPDQSGGPNGSTAAFVTYAQFDATTGLPISTTDANGLETQIEYDQTTLRPRYVRTYSNNVQVGTTTETVYHDETDNYWVKSRSQIDESHWAESITYFDGLGRAYKTEEVNSHGNIFVLKEFDAEGRVKRVSNPYRITDTDCYSSTIQAPTCWTTNVYDTASRVIEVDLPDNSKVLTDYGVSISAPVGITKMITDQAGKKRKGTTDALGNMVRVVEDPGSGKLNYITDYVFDTLGNLRKTSQGEQNRYFCHDSLGRLLYAKQVEQDANSSFSGANYADPITGNNQWSVKYVYDDNSNITSTTDARNVSISATYDHLNRIISRDYSDTTPDVSFYYDGKGLPSVPDHSKGKTTKVTSSTSETTYRSFDVFGRVLSHRQTTDGVDYDTAYSYNLSGALIEETYPSGRVVKNTVDQDGDLSQVQGKKNSNYGYWTYASSFSSDAAGNLTKMQLGNGRWENFQYNNRQQVTQIGLGTTDSIQDLLKLEYSYKTTGIDDNNGSLREQKITVPTVGSNSGFTANQAYTYDELNRISSATETVSSTQTWKQTFDYDRYGNRTFDTTNNHTTTLGSCAAAVCNPAVSTSNNRFSSTSYSYDPNGSVTQDVSGQRFGYDAENHQKEFFNASNSGSTPDATYFYDGSGLRVEKITAAETTVFVYDASSQLVAEYSTQLAQVQQVSYLTQDHLGSPRIVTNENGAATSRKDYSAFGEETITSERVLGLGYTTPEIRQDYTGYQNDVESGLEYAQARYYNSQHGRFTSADPLASSATIRNPQTFNRYSYVLNSPYKFADPLGLLAVTTGACGQFCQNVVGGPFNGPTEFDDNSFTYWRLPESYSTEAENSPILGLGTYQSEQQSALLYQTSQVEPPSSDPVLASQEKDLANLVTDGTGIVRADGRGASINGSPTHFRTADGRVFTIHVYGDEKGETKGNIYVPAGWDVVFDKKRDQVNATNKKTGQLIVFAHVDVHSQKDLVRNLQKQNTAGSRFIGQMNNGGGEKGYIHAHITIYKNAAGRESILRQQYGPTGYVRDQRGWDDFRSLVPRH